MAFSHFSWPKIISLTAIKYQRPGFIDKKPFLPGELSRAMMEMERGVKGYRELRKELVECRKTMEKQEEMRINKMERKIQTSYYKSPVATRLVHFVVFFLGRKSFIPGHTMAVVGLFTQTQWGGIDSSLQQRKFLSHHQLSYTVFNTN